MKSPEYAGPGRGLPMIGGPIRDFIRRRFSREEAIGLSFTVSFLVSACLAVVIALLAREVGRSGGWSESLDVGVSETLVGLRSPPMNALMLAITFLGDQWFLAVTTPAVAVALWLRRRHVASVLFALSVLGGFALNVFLKVTIGRARPDRWAVLVTETSPSFPSGHTLMATVLFGALAATVFHVSRNRLARILAVAVATAIVLAVASSRVYLGAHWATDTLAGMLAGSIWVLMYSATTASVTRVRNRRLVDPGSP